MHVATAPETERLRPAIEHLAAIERAPCSEGEREAQALLRFVEPDAKGWDVALGEPA